MPIIAAQWALFCSTFPTTTLRVSQMRMCFVRSLERLELCTISKAWRSSGPIGPRAHHQSGRAFGRAARCHSTWRRRLWLDRLGRQCLVPLLMSIGHPSRGPACLFMLVFHVRCRCWFCVFGWLFFSIYINLTVCLSVFCVFTMSFNKSGASHERNARL